MNAQQKVVGNFKIGIDLRTYETNHDLCFLGWRNVSMRNRLFGLESLLSVVIWSILTAYLLLFAGAQQANAGYWTGTHGCDGGVQYGEGSGIEAAVADQKCYWPQSGGGMVAGYSTSLSGKETHVGAYATALHNNASCQIFPSLNFQCSGF